MHKTKKNLILLARIVIAVLGVAYVVWIVQWTDRVHVAAGIDLGGGWVVGEAQSFKVLSGRFDPRRPGDSDALVIESSPGGQTATVPASRLTEPDGAVQFLPGLATMIRQADAKLLLAGLLVVGPIYLLVMVRWWMLLRARGLNVSLGKAFRLTMVSNFFNFCMPGTTGGDLVKAYYAAKGSGRKTDAVMTVIVDRIMGLLGLILLAGLMGLLILDHPKARVVTINIWLLLLAMGVAAGVYFSTRLRRLFRVDWVLSKLPMRGLISRVDEAAVAYRDHKGMLVISVGMSIVVHACLAVATSLAGFALGMDRMWGLLMTVVPVLFLAGALPISPQGIGVMEALAKELLMNPPSITANQIVGMLLLIRLYQMFYSLFGSLYLLKGDIHLHPQEEGSQLPGGGPSLTVSQ